MIGSRRGIGEEAAVGKSEDFASDRKTETMLTLGVSHDNEGVDGIDREGFSRRIVLSTEPNDNRPTICIGLSSKM